METDNRSDSVEPGNIVERNGISTICGFWRRIFAFIIDGIILGIFGLIIGTAFFEFFVEIGGLGLFLGFAVALVYFGVQNSFICGGQTLGKRLLKIKVVDKDNETISLQRSFTRFMVLGPPYFLNGAHLPPDLVNNYFASLILGLIVFFGLSGIVYLYIFNKKTRQSLHDLVVGTYVVNSPTAAESAFQPGTLWKGHFAILSVMFLSIVFVITSVVPKLGQEEFFREVSIVQNKIYNTGLVHAATVSAGNTVGSKLGTEGHERWETTHLSVTAVLKKKPADYNVVINDIAKIVLDNYPPINEKDALVVIVTYGYDIGIATAWIKQRQQHSPEDWRRFLSGLSKMSAV